MKRFYWMAVLCSVVAACDDSGGVVSPADALLDVATSDSAVANDVVQPADTAVADVATADTVEQGSCLPGEGCFGEGCASADDCLSGICTMHLGDKMCSKTCDASCPEGWSCNLVSTGNSDSQYVCVSNFSHLCLPCETAEGCFGDNPNACVRYPDGLSFCGGSCDLATPCPSGYNCQEVDTTSGVKSYQCMSTAGVCLCSNLAIESSLASPCEVTNEYGTCMGLRACVENGLSECDAVIPGPEICNGIDDDCNGNVDELTCDDGNSCTVDTCLGEGGCEHVNQTEGECLDGDVCTIADHCDEGVCVGTPIECDDGNACTDDACDGLGGCSFINNTIPCDDGDDCTLGELCAEGACLPEVTLSCDDGNPCTQDACDTVTGCSHVPTDALCDDGNACTTDDACLAGQCTATLTLGCDDENPCTTDLCSPNEGCSSVVNTLPCNDENTCTTSDICSEGLCAGGEALNCNDGNPCTDDVCDPLTGCSFVANEAPCDDANECTASSVCADGGCKGLDSVDCDDGNLCTTDTCVPATGCASTFNNVPCDDGDLCTPSDLCTEGACQGSGALPCDDGNPCTDDTCDAAQGCVFTPNLAPCDDGNACTENDACGDGSCKAVSVVQCNDGNPCTDDQCFAEQGCVFTSNESPCDDANACTANDTCVDGDCESGPPIDCNDGLFCNGQESCSDAIGCLFGPAPTIDDGIPCTADSCDEGGDTVVHTPNSALCDDGDVCNGTENCSIVSGCTNGASLNCEDGVGCTAESCDPQNGCNSVPENAACNDNNPCTTDTCAPNIGCEHTAAVNGTPCDGGTCQSGTCTACEVGVIDFGHTGGSQTFTIPNCASVVEIDVYGAQAGSANGGNGGRGARMRSAFTELAGKTIQIRVGGIGLNGNGGVEGGGGGGGSFVFIANENYPLIVAGGGGGASYQGSDGQPGLTSKLGGPGGYGPAAEGQGGVTDNGGGGGTGAGGGGWFGNGASNGWAGGGSSGGGAGGNTDYNGKGGYGGGGAAYHGGGGGGGYSGGSGGTYGVGGGGGGSYSAGQLMESQSGHQNGHGKVIVTIN
jgi:hypothetical protein